MTSQSAPSDQLTRRHNINLMGSGSVTLLLVHGYGCNQSMWRQMAPVLADRYRVVLVDLLGFGDSDLSAYDQPRYDSLEAHAEDIAEIGRSLGTGPLVLVGHSVGGIIGLLADAKAPDAFAAHIMVAPSPCYRNDGAYQGGFDDSELDALLQSQEADWDSWSRLVSRLVMGLPDWQPLTGELLASFCRADRRAATQLARATFLGDYRDALPALKKPTLILQSTEDRIAPPAVGEFTSQAIAGSTLRLVPNVGHCPHLTAASECLREMEAFLRRFDAETLADA
jgi:sigma-B regulation protein RsbQ